MKQLESLAKRPKKAGQLEDYDAINKEHFKKEL